MQKGLILLFGIYFYSCNAQIDKMIYKVNYLNDSVKISEGYLVDNKKIGKWFFYYDNQSINKILFYNIDTNLYNIAKHVNIDSLAKVNKLNQNVFSYEEKIDNKVTLENNIGVVCSIEIPLFEYFPNKKIKSYCDIKNDSIILYSYYESQKIEGKEMVKNSALNGEAFYYYPNGKVKSNGKYLNSKKNGLWIYYSKKGKKLKQINYP